MSKQFLPISKEDLDSRGISELDIIIVTGDAYVDHPSYGAALIGRVLESAGFKVGVIAQGDLKDASGLTRLGRPRLFFAVTAGNLDSLVANYTANKKNRRLCGYSPGGIAGFRPDRAVIIYTNKIKELFPGARVVIGGLEASLRRLAHYDYWSDKVRRSVLLDSKADILVYGMGERQIVEIAKRSASGEDLRAMRGIRGTVIASNAECDLKDGIHLPSFEEVSSNNDKFNEAIRIIYRENDPIKGKALIQKHGLRYAIQYPPALPLDAPELDRIYELEYARRWHPVYDAQGGVPGFETVRSSVTALRGCSAACRFCSLFLHQGRIVQSRSIDSIIREIEKIASSCDFKGTISDIGGPTANLYGASCALWKDKGACSNRECLTPSKCANLKLGYDKSIELFRKARKAAGVKHVFISSGVRYDLLTDAYSDAYLKELCAYHISGYLKVAPEHNNELVLRLMDKPPFSVYEKFFDRFTAVNKMLKKKQYLVNYFICGHPGSSLKEAAGLSDYFKKKGLRPEQIQDFMPLPMTASGAAYYTGKDPFSRKSIHVARGARERRLQRALMQYFQPGNKQYVAEALRLLKKGFVHFILALVIFMNAGTIAEAGQIKQLKKSGDRSILSVKPSMKLPLPRGYHEGLYFDGKNMWVANGKNGKIVVVSPSLKKVISKIRPIGPFTEGITKSKDGKFYVTDWEDQKLYKAHLDGNKLIKEKEISLAPSYPAGVIWTGENLFVVTWTRDDATSDVGTRYHILKMDEEGRLLERIAVIDIKEPAHLGWDGKYLWVTSWNNQLVYKVDIAKWECIGMLLVPMGDVTGIVWSGKDLWLTGTHSDLYKLEVVE